MSGPLPNERFEELEFDIVREVWNIHVLDDGARIRTRAILTKVLRQRHDPERGSEQQAAVDLGYQAIVIAYAPDELKGPPNRSPPPPETVYSLPKQEMKIMDVESQDWNVYKLKGDGAELKLMLDVKAIHKITGLYTEDGSPFYVVTSSVNFATDEPVKQN